MPNRYTSCFPFSSFFSKATEPTSSSAVPLSSLTPFRNAHPVTGTVLVRRIDLPSFYFRNRPYTSPRHVQQTCSCLVTAEHFEKLKILGTGDVGRVYLVKRKSSEKYFAMKVLSKAEMLKRNKLRRVITEQNILSALHHPFLIHLYHAFETPTHFFLCLEYCPGGDLHRLLRKHRTLSESTTRFFVMEIILALSYLHVHDVIYRDLKPENVVLHGSGHIKLTDFDLSCHQVSDTRSLVGTEAYVAPEIVTGDPQSAMVDWWTLGIFMYECLFGITPFMGSDVVSTFYNIVHGPLRFSSHLHVSLHAKALIQGLLQKPPSHRFTLHHIQSHPWFHGCSFALIRHRPPPFKPPSWIEVDLENTSLETETKDLKVNSDAEKGELSNYLEDHRLKDSGWVNASWILDAEDPMNE